MQPVPEDEYNDLIDRIRPYFDYPDDVKQAFVLHLNTPHLIRSVSKQCLDVVLTEVPSMADDKNICYFLVMNYVHQGNGAELSSFGPSYQSVFSGFRDLQQSIERQDFRPIRHENAILDMMRIEKLNVVRCICEAGQTTPIAGHMFDNLKHAYAVINDLGPSRHQPLNSLLEDLDNQVIEVFEKFQSSSTTTQPVLTATGN